jgi:hypothetical protein
VVREGVDFVEESGGGFAGEEGEGMDTGAALLGCEEFFRG